MAGKGATMAPPVGHGMIGEPGTFGEGNPAMPPDTMPETDTPETGENGATDTPAKEETETSRLKYLRRAALDFGQFDGADIVKVAGVRYVAAVRKGENPILISWTADLYRAIYG